MSIWTNEDGDCYFSEGHVSKDVMIERCIAAEKHWLGRDYPEPKELEEEIRNGTLSHFWEALDCEWSEEGSHVVAEGTPDAQPITRLQRK